MTTQTHASPLLAAADVRALFHDLQQYITAAHYLTEICDGAQVDAEAERRLELIGRALTHVRELINSTTQALDTSATAVELHDLVADCVTVARIGHTVTFELDGPPPVVLGDPVLLHRAVDNLLNNAGRASQLSPHGGDIDVRVGSDATRAWVEVSDHGPGFGHLAPGSGQGLTVVSAALRSGGGRLEISSEPGRGATIRMSFPRLSVEAKRLPLQQHRTALARADFRGPTQAQ